MMAWLHVAELLRGGDSGRHPRLLPLPVVEDHRHLVVLRAGPWPVKAHVMRRTGARTMPWRVIVYAPQARETDGWHRTAGPHAVMTAVAQDKAVALLAARRMLRGWALGVALTMAGVN